MRRATALLFGLTILGLVARGRAETPELENPQLHVFVFDDAGASIGLVAHAEQAAAHVFREAGIGVQWVNCEKALSTRCASEIRAGNLVVRIIPRPLTAQPEIFGVSFLAPDGAGAYADVFLDRIRELRKESNVISLASTLGDVMAHELGHLLLGSGAHSPQGIMQPHWQSQQLRDVSTGRMVFTSEQAERIRAKVATLKKANHEVLLLEAMSR